MVTKEDARRVAGQALQPGEELLWADGAGHYPSGPGAAGLLSGLLGIIVFGGFVVAGFGESLGGLLEAMGSNPVFLVVPVFMIAVLALGVWMQRATAHRSVPPVPRDVLESRVYAVTSERLLVIDREEARSFVRREVGTPWVRRRQYGSADVLFDLESSREMKELFRQTQQGMAKGIAAAMSYSMGQVSEGDGFILVDDAQGVRDLIERWLDEGEGEE